MLRVVDFRTFKGFVVGVDVGQVRDFTAVTVLERTGSPLRSGEDVYHVVDLQQLPLGTTYTEVTGVIADLAAALRGEALARLDLVERTNVDVLQVVVDGTGVGRPVVDLLRKELWDRGLFGCLSEVVFTGGIDPAVKPTSGGVRFTVPKADLVCAVSVALEQGRLKIARELPLAPLLVEQLKALRRWLDPRTGRDTYGAPEEIHDDLAMSLAVALWWAEKTGRPWGAYVPQVANRGL